MATDGLSFAGEDVSILKLRCSVKNYDWGRIGSESSVAQLYNKNNGKEIDEAMPYAEFWMGTHDSGPSYVVSPFDKGILAGTGEVTDGSALDNKGELMSLKEWIEQNPRKVLGDKVFNQWGPNLPFLFKALSVAKALSIQAHPNKKLAAKLHQLKPSSYKDDNHKPEMALALTEFEALCGFVTLEELKEIVRDFPEIEVVVGTKAVDQLQAISDQDGTEKGKKVLQMLFSLLMLASENVTRQALSSLKDRLEKKREAAELTAKEKLILRLEKQYPADIGILAALFLNYLRLRPGEALYLGADEPHAYLEGDCIECMATSDNVVRAGLTPKERDVETLCSMLTYKQGLPEILQGADVGLHMKKYQPPFDEFEVDYCDLPGGGASVVVPFANGPSIFVVVNGEGTISSSSQKLEIHEGDVLFTHANTEITLETTESCLDIYRAGISSNFFLPE